MIKIDGKGDSEAVVGFERCGFITVADGDRLSHPDKAFGLLLFFDARRLQQVYKGPAEPSMIGTSAESISM